VIIQVRSGGNLADMMHRLADVIRDRMRLKRRVRVLTAQTQLSKRVLLVLPFLLFGVLNLLNPTYMMPLYTTSMGRTLLVVAGTGLMLGVWVMNRLSVLKY
jgi:tight adherence protein B